MGAVPSRRRRPRTDPRRAACVGVAIAVVTWLTLVGPVGAQSVLPGPPSNLTATVVNDILAVTWDPPATGAPFLAYVLYVGGSGVPGVVSIPTVSPSFSTPLTGFVGTLSFAVAALNTVGEGPQSPPTSVTVGPGATPSPPLNLAASVTGDVLTITWDPPATGAPIITYLLRFAGPGSPGGGTLPVAGTSFSTSGVGGLAGTYSLAVSAVNQLGEGPPSATATVTFGPAARPGAPLNLVASVTGDVLRLTWDPPATGAPITFYRLRAGGPGASAFGPIQVDRTSFATPWSRGIVGTYSFAVSAVNQLGEGPPSAAVSLTFGATAVPSVPLNFVASVTNDILTLTWDPPASGTPVTTYLLRASGPGVAAFGALPVAGRSFSTSVAGAAAATFLVAVSAVNHLGEGPMTAPLTVTLGPTTVPDPPQNFSAVVAGNVLTVSWSPPATGAPINHYVLRATGSSFSGVWTLQTPNVSFAVAADQLANGNYTFAVSATNALGEGAPTASQTVTIGPPCPVPTATVLTASTIANVVSLTWTTPLVGQVTSYTLRVSTSAGGATQIAADVGLVNALSAPAPSGTYFLQVVAQSACGTGAPSNQVRVDVP
jgi:hypothetical protein